ncbi:hypothetical protein [Streptomyces sp. NPDC002851]
MTGRTAKRVSTVVGLAVSAVLALAPGAWANWQSYIVSWTDGETYTNCFRSSTSVSSGEWTGLPVEEDYFFEADKIGQGGSFCLLNVSKVYVDTTLADS